VHREWSMVTGAVFATRRTLMEELGGFDERFSLEFNDTDLALRLRAAGYRIVSTPFAQMVHTERASRRDTPPPPEEAELFYQRWSHWLANDPSWHPGLDRNRVEVMPSPISEAWYL
jgi:O-antigen biosynthesis protein